MMVTKINDTQFLVLSQYESYFRTAVESQYARHPGRSALVQIHAIFTAATGDKRRLDDNCQTCIFNLLKDCGMFYFEEKRRREAVKVTRTKKSKKNEDGENTNQ